MLKHILPKVPFRLQTDASDRGIAGILYQIDEIGDHNIVAIVSRCLNRAECNYTITEKELLAVMYSIEKFRVYLIGVNFTIVTDHQCLTFLKSTNFQNARVTRWSLLLQQFSFTIEYCRGIDNVVADFFSRNPEGRFNEDVSNRIIISALHKAFLPVMESTESSLLSVALMKADKDLKKSFREIAQLQKDDLMIQKSIMQNKPGSDKLSIQIYNDIVLVKERNKQK